MSQVTTATAPVLEARGIVKLFGRVVGLSGVDLKLHAGEVLAIIGDNGAGKSTLIKCLSGAMMPEDGELFVNGERVTFRNTKEAREARPWRSRRRSTSPATCSWLARSARKAPSAPGCGCSTPRR